MLEALSWAPVDLRELYLPARCILRIRRVEENLPRCFRGFREFQDVLQVF